MTPPILSEEETPFFSVDRVLIRRNMEIARYIKENCGAKILLALKGFAMFSAFNDMNHILDGSCASSPHEARMAKEDFGGEVHSHGAAFSDRDMEEIVELSSHVSLNSISQYERFLPLIEKSQENGKHISFGLRINPEYSETDMGSYDPCGPHSRLGITRKNFTDRLPKYIEGIHFHTLNANNADSLKRTLKVVEKNFGDLLHKCRWVNFGGGHHIASPNYDLDLLCSTIRDFRKKYDVEVYLEPGEGLAHNMGFLTASVIDIVRNEMDIAILDTSAETHIPDVLIIPERPNIIDAGLPGELGHDYRLSGPTCLAGDIMGDYSFREKLKVGDRLVFTDMAHYTMVKTNTFNGIKLPSIYYVDSEENKILHRKEFDYEDFRGRLS